jgi:hypothetical protein
LLREVKRLHGGQNMTVGPAGMKTWRWWRTLDRLADVPTRLSDQVAEFREPQMWSPRGPTRYAHPDDPAPKRNEDVRVVRPHEIWADRSKNIIAPNGDHRRRAVPQQFHRGVHLGGEHVSGRGPRYGKASQIHCDAGAGGDERRGLSRERLVGRVRPDAR